MHNSHVSTIAIIQRNSDVIKKRIQLNKLVELWNKIELE